jgi:hypothetical protein
LVVECRGDDVIPDKWNDLAEFQLQIAERWRDRGARTEDPFARFFFYFAGVNALYYLWSKVDGVRRGKQGRPPNEVEQIEHLLSKAEPCAAEVLAGASQCVEYFADRQPIERMDKRSQVSAREGDAREGRAAGDALRSGSDTERLGALGKILYIVRSNLVHGSKMDQGDDQDVVEHAVPGLEAILNWAIGHTRSELGRA